MIRISGIYTIRDCPHPYYWDIVYEWEDQIAHTLGIPLIPVGKKYDEIYQPSTLKKILNRINAYQLWDKYFFSPQNHYLAFHIGPPGVYSFYTRKNVIPIIIDFWKHENIKRFEAIFRLSPAVLISSREVYNYLKSVTTEVKIKHLALSLPDKFLEATTSMIRDIDVIQIGRNNETFDGYMKELLAEFPDVHYVYARRQNHEIHIMSNKYGFIDVFNKREDFIALLNRSKISLVSAPGLDDDRKRTGGFSPVTPRFFESAACRCKLLGIYPENADFEYYGINEICRNVTSYDQFKDLIREYLRTQTVPDFTSFLENHLTSKRANQMLKILQEHNG